MGDPSIVRNRAKIEATINNAKRTVELVEAEGSLARYVWGFEPDGRPERLDRAALIELARSPESAALAKDLKRRGWSFVGPTTVYAFMQAMGLVNDHLIGCDAGDAVAKQRKRFKRPWLGRSRATLLRRCRSTPPNSSTACAAPGASSPRRCRCSRTRSHPG